MEYGTRLREIRKAKGFSMYKLHKESGLSQGHISDLEKCINQPTIETLQKLLTPMALPLPSFSTRKERFLSLLIQRKSLWQDSEHFPKIKQTLPYR